MKPELQAYFINQHTTTSKEKLIEMLYDGLIKFLSQSLIAIENHNIEKKCNLLSKSIAIIEELVRSLDMNGGQIAEYLNGLYSYHLNNLFLANLENNAARVQQTLNVAKVLRDVWKEQTNIEQY